jgi:nucleoid DNA-binding protein
MSRTKIDWRSGSKANYLDFCKKNPKIIITFIEWKNIVYSYNDLFRMYILETGEKVKMPFGFGQFSINKKKRKRRKGKKGEFINMAVDWQKSKKLGKRIYNMNHHTDGYFFGWLWFKATATFKQRKLWYFKPARTTSRLLNHYIITDNKYQHIYKEWLK